MFLLSFSGSISHFGINLQIYAWREDNIFSFLLSSKKECLRTLSGIFGLAVTKLFLKDRNRGKYGAYMKDCKLHLQA